MARRELEIYVVCPRCQVTHPPGTARCLYCGDPTLRPSEVSAVETPASSAAVPAQGGEPREEERPEATPGALLLRGFGETLVLLLLALALALYRTCRSGG